MSRREAPNEMNAPARYRNRIHEESRKADQPFKFSAPKKSKPSNTAVACTHCGKWTFVTATTIMVICSRCSRVYKVDKETSKKVGTSVWSPEKDGEDA